MTEIPAAESRKADLKDAGQLWGDLYGHHWAWDTTSLTWRCWQETHWADLGTRHTDLDRQAMEVLRIALIPVASPSVINGTIRAAATVCHRAFPRRPGLVNFSNGTLDVTQDALRDHNRQDGLIYCLPYPYQPGPHPHITQFLEETIPDPIGREAFLIHCGLALLADTHLHQVVLLIGPPRSGKSTLLELANAICGQEPAAFAGPSLFSREAEGLKSRAAWSGRRLVAIDELPVEALQNEGLVKIMGAHGGVEMRRMYSAQVMDNQWIPKLLLNTNDAPRYADRSGALTARLVPVRCPNSRADHPETQDVRLLEEKLLPELSAFVATCLAAARAMLQSNRGRYPLSMEMLAELTDIEQGGDALKSFLADECAFDDAGFCEGAVLYQEYCRYCKENGNTPLSRGKMMSAIKDRHPRVKIGVVQRVENRTCRGVEGLRWRTQAEKDAELNVTDVTDVTVPYKPAITRARDMGGLSNGVTSVTSVTTFMQSGVRCSFCEKITPCECDHF